MVGVGGRGSGGDKTSMWDTSSRHKISNEDPDEMDEDNMSDRTKGQRNKEERHLSGGH